MWDTPFDESMLSAQPGVAIFCEEDSLADELFELFRLNGLGKNWSAGERGGRVYCVSGKSLRYSSKSDVERTNPYSKFTRCTFYGIESADFDVANDDELRSLLGV